MIKIKNYVFIFFLSLIIAHSVSGQISSSDKTQIQNQINVIVNSINNNDIKEIINIISPSARPGLKDEIQSNLEGKRLIFEESISSYEDLGDNKVKVNGIYAAKGIGWVIQGMPNYFIFEKYGNSWLLVDTDFHKKLGSEYVFGIIKKISIFAIPIFIATSAFWVWMLIDVLKRDFENKVLWIILLLILGFLGAILYFFIIRRKLNKKEQNTSYQKV